MLISILPIKNAYKKTKLANSMRNSNEKHKTNQAVTRNYDCRVRTNVSATHIIIY